MGLPPSPPPHALDPPSPSVLGELVGGFGRKSLIALVLLLTVGCAVGYRWSDLVDANGILDGLLVGIWLSIAVLLAWRVAPRRDGIMIAVGLGGGATIEWWGTNSELWAYFTGERPPLWILPAWPAATLAIDRLASAFDLFARRSEGVVSERAWRRVYFVLVPAFVLWMTTFLWPRGGHFASQVVVLLMVLTAVYTREPRRDVMLFCAGTAMGLALEYWGTSRECWTYYTRQVPPPVAVVAHGVAAVAFARVAGIADRALGAAAARLRPFVLE